MSLSDTALAIQESAFGVALRESPIGFPVVEGLHLLGLAASFGLLVFIDLRLLGLLLREVPAAQLMNSLRRWLFGGFALTFITGGLLFWSAAHDLLHNTPFLIKVGLMVLALANALYFEWRLRRTAGTAGEAAALSPSALRLAGGLSLSLWTLVTITGRLIPYYAHH